MLRTLINEPDKDNLREQLATKTWRPNELHGYCSEWMCAAAAILLF